MNNYQHTKKYSCKTTAGKCIAFFLLTIFILLASGGHARAQQASAGQSKVINGPPASVAGNRTDRTAPAAAESSGEIKTPDGSDRERVLLERIDRLERRVAELEARAAATKSAGMTISSAGNQPTAVTTQQPAPTATSGNQEDLSKVSTEDRNVLSFFRDTAINVTLDGYYGYNFNRPVGRINLLRAYDVSSNSFSLNQPTVAIESAPDVAAGRRCGLGLNLLYGQAPEAMQGRPANGLRPQVYRPVWPAYGIYVVPLGHGLTLDSGKSLLDGAAAQDAPSEESQQQQSESEWQYGGFVDLGYLLDFNHPSNRVFRSRGTAWHVDKLHLNMAGAYVKKKASEPSRWGVELLVHAGKDAEVFGFSATAPNIGGFRWLRHLGLANVSYLAPVGKGLTLQGGIFGSLIGYDSLYAKDNFNYTRPWGADFTPYLMMGVNASYPFNENLTGTFFVVNGYWHLARANNVPSSGGQFAYKASPRVTVKETVLWGPHQSNTSFKFWRFLSDSLVEHKGDRVTFAFEYIISSERVDVSGSPRALFMASQLPVHWALNKRWSLTVRPEVAWDRDGRWTLARQTVKALTTTLEYRIPYRWTNTILRLEHRYDDSRGPEGGFFRGAEVRPDVVGLTPTQHLLIFGLIFTFDSPAHP